MNECNIGETSDYQNIQWVYSQCSGPGGLKAAELIADKMEITAGSRLLDIGMNRGVQTCFLAHKFGCFTIGIDPWDDRGDNRPHIDHLMDNARKLGVEDRVLGIKVGVPETRLPDNSFDYAFSTTTFEMIRGMNGEEAYIQCLKEVYRVLKPGGVLGLGEPMRLCREIPEDIKAFAISGDLSFDKCFATLEVSRNAVVAAGFQILDMSYAGEARQWWEEYARYDPFCLPEEKRAIRDDGGRWIGYGIIIGVKPRK